MALSKRATCAKRENEANSIHSSATGLLGLIKAWLIKVGLSLPLCTRLSVSDSELALKLAVALLASGVKTILLFVVKKECVYVAI